VAESDPGSGLKTARRRRVHVEAADGFVLALEYVPSVGPPKGACLAGHAMAVNGRTLDHPRHRGLASELASSGFEVYVMDLRGHGRSVNKGRADWSFDDLVVFDLPAVMSAIRQRHPELPIVGLGHSLGGNALCAYLGTVAEHGPEVPTLSALVTVATTIWLPRFETRRLRRLVQRVLCEVVAATARWKGVFPVCRLRLGSNDIPPRFAQDLLRWVRSGVWSSRGGVDYGRQLQGANVPVLALFAGGDRLFCPPAAGMAFHHQLPVADLKVETVGPSMVGFRPGHMDLVLDERCRVMWKFAGDWLLERIRQQGEIENVRSG